MKREDLYNTLDGFKLVGALAHKKKLFDIDSDGGQIGADVFGIGENHPKGSHIFVEYLDGDKEEQVLEDVISIFLIDGCKSILFACIDDYGKSFHSINSPELITGINVSHYEKED